MEREPRITVLRSTEKIGGQEWALGLMQYSELLVLYEGCLERAQQAEEEAAVVARYMDAKFPEGPDEAA